MNSKIILVKNINTDKEYTNVLSYSENDMLALCRSEGHLIAEANDYSFIRQTGTIMAGFTYAQCLQANYIAFQNPDYSNKWFFAWVDDVVYKGEKNTEIIFTVDAWSTWFSYWTKKTCFINRQHVNDDTIGLHTVPENLDIGQVVEEAETEDEAYGNSTGYWLVVASNYTIKDNTNGNELLPADKGSQYSGITVHDNVVFGTKLFLFHITQLSDFASVYLFLERTNLDGHIQDVENLFIVPDAVVTLSELTSHTAYLLNTDKPFYWYTMGYDMTPYKFNTTISKLTAFNDYTPKNNKCFVYPYNYLFVSNNNGSNNIYKYEDFGTENCVFENQLSISIGVSGRIVPKSYKRMSYNDDEALPLGKYPTCAWSSDAFTNWLTQNGVNMAVSLGMVAGGIALSAATFGAAAAPSAVATAAFIGGTATTVASAVGNTIGQFYSASLLPNINGGQATGDVVWACNRNKFTFRKMRVKTEYLKIIDDYFTRFGYAIKCLGLPNITGRTYWNYVEIGASEEIGYGDVPSKYMEIINNACRKGVTIWHNHANVGNYSLNNTIVT